MAAKQDSAQSKADKCNEARKIIWQLSTPLAEIAQLIQDNIILLDRHKDSLSVEGESINVMTQKLYMPVVDLEVKDLEQPLTVCAAPKCTEVYQVGTLQKRHYRQICHNPCSLKGIKKDIVGDSGLKGCAAMGGSDYCKICSCHYSIHMHIYYITTIKANNEDIIIQTNIKSKQEVIEKTRGLIEQIDKRKKELEDEHSFVVNSLAKFAIFLEKNAMIPYNDAYKKYIQHLIDQEKSLGNNADDRVLKNVEKLLVEYNTIKSTLEKSLENFIRTPEYVNETVEKLYNLTHNGKKIRELSETQERLIHRIDSGQLPHHNKDSTKSSSDNESSLCQKQSNVPEEQVNEPKVKEEHLVPSENEGKNNKETEVTKEKVKNRRLDNFWFFMFWLSCIATFFFSLSDLF